MQPTTSYVNSYLIPPSGPAQAWVYRSGFKQPRPYDVLTPYSAFHKRVEKVYYGGHLGMQNVWTRNGDVPFSAGDIAPGGADESSEEKRYLRGLASDAMNAALSKLQGKAFDEEASLGATIGESREGFQMINARVTQLAKAAMLLSRGRFFDVAKTLNLVVKEKPSIKRYRRSRVLRWAQHPSKTLWYPRPKKTWRSEVKDISGLWLEYSFGWSPMVSDILAAQRVLERSPYVSTTIRAASKVSGSITNYNWTSSFDYSSRHTLSVKAVVGGVYRVSNPNYDLSARLGLVNPASVILELTKLSFVWASWLTNFDDWVGNLSDGYRSQMVNTWWGYRCTGENESRIYYRMVDRWDNWVVSSDSSYIRNVGSLPGVVLRVRQRFIPSFKRAANASALLVSLFLKGK